MDAREFALICIVMEMMVIIVINIEHRHVLNFIFY